MFIKGSVYLVALLAVQQVVGNHLKFGSDHNMLDKEPINASNSHDALLKLCNDPKVRISRVSSIPWLLREVGNINDESLAACKEQYLDPLNALYPVTDLYQDDLCSSYKVELIEQFQWDYQMGAMSKKWRKFAKGPLPESLMNFFLHYVSEVTSLCKASLPNNIALTASQMDSSKNEASDLDESFGRVVDQFQKVLIPFDSVKSYDNFVLLWDLMINHEKKKNVDIVIKDPASNENLVALLKVKDASKVWAAQEKCRRFLRPVYRNTVLPVMKLIDMGYDTKDKQLDNEISNNPEEKEWYMLTQTCELLMPLKFYEDKSMKIWDTGILESFDEAANYNAELRADGQLAELPEVKAQTIGLPDQLSSALKADEKKLLKSVKANAKSRGHLYRKIARGAMSNAMRKSFSGRQQVLAMLKKLKLTGGKKVEDDEEIAEETLKATEKFLTEDEKLDSEGTGLARMKRGDFKYPSDRKRKAMGILVGGFLILMIIIVVGLMVSVFVFGIMGG